MLLAYIVLEGHVFISVTTRDRPKFSLGFGFGAESGAIGAFGLTGYG